MGDANINSLIGGFFLLRFLNPAIVTPNGMIHSGAESLLQDTCYLESLIILDRNLFPSENVAQYYVTGFFELTSS